MNEAVAATAETSLLARYLRTRAQTVALCRTLTPEDMVVQPSEEASPTKWHLAHTTWFFEQFILGRRASYKPFREGWAFLFNSYYQAVGPMHARAKRGLLTRPGVKEVFEYREAIDRRMSELLAGHVTDDVAKLVEIGINHEQQHQELLVMDAKVTLSSQPLRPAFREGTPSREAVEAFRLRFIRGAEGIADVGAHAGGFSFDNEGPRHRTLLSRHALANRLATNGEYLEFIRDGGYSKPALWLAEGWSLIQARGWRRPLYWEEDLASEYTLDGVTDLDPSVPVSHVSFYEADAFSRWSKARLPTEFEWEAASAHAPFMAGNFLESDALRPLPAAHEEGLSQMFGDVWEWTGSPYVSYPGYRAPEGAIGEYNGKFMSSQWVLRGGSCVTPKSHIRPTYRNFFYPADRWQFSGIRLAIDL